MAAKPIPDGYRTMTPHLVLRDAAATMEFYKKAFGAEEIGRMPGPDGKVMHAEMRIGDSRFMVNDEFPEMGARSPVSIGGSPVTVHLYVPDADAVFNSAVAAGAKGVWLQSGIVSPEAEQVAAEAGIDFVQDRCLKVEHMFHGGR